MLHDLFFDKYLAPYLHLPSSPGAPNPLGAVSTLPQLVYRYITLPHIPAVYGEPHITSMVHFFHYPTILLITTHMNFIL